MKIFIFSQSLPLSPFPYFSLFSSCSPYVHPSLPPSLIWCSLKVSSGFFLLDYSCGIFIYCYMHLVFSFRLYFFTGISFAPHLHFSCFFICPNLSKHCCFYPCIRTGCFSYSCFSLLSLHLSEVSSFSSLCFFSILFSLLSLSRSCFHNCSNFHLLCHIYITILYFFLFF